MPRRYARAIGRRALAVAAATALGLIPAGAASAATEPLVTIRDPAAGAVISRAASQILGVSGAARYATPEPTERTYYVGKRCDGTECWLSTAPTHSTTGGWLEQITPLNELSEDPVAVDFVPKFPGDRKTFTLDSSRPLTGVVTIASGTLGLNLEIGFGLTEVDVTVTAEAVGGEMYTLGSTTVEYMAISTPGDSIHREPWSVDLLAALDKRDFTGEVTLTLVVRGYNVLHGYTVSDDTNLTVPTYSASFDRRVEVAVDGSWFSADGITLADDHETWTGTITTPAVGTHTLRARAVQGWHWDSNANFVPLTSPVATRTFTVTD